MALRCLVFSDEETWDLIRPVLLELGVEGEACPDAPAAIDKIARDPFQLVVIDWERQPEAGILLTTARERKPAERPLTLAIVADDISIPKALQAGANSVLRKPLLVNQVKDTLTTARDLLRSRQESIASPGKPPASEPSSISATALPSRSEGAKETTLRAGEFLQTPSAAPGGHFVTETDVPRPYEQSVPSEIDPLKDLEPVASAVPEQRPVPPPPPPDEPRSLESLLKARGAMSHSAAAPKPARSSSPELLEYGQTPSYSAGTAAADNPAILPARQPQMANAREQNKEAELFAYIQGDGEKEPSRSVLSKFKPVIWGALLLAVCATLAAPQAPWHPQMQSLWSRGKKSLHTWLNPQPVTPLQAPAAHEDFGRAGDEYKLPVAETIPDATTDPSQISVLPVVDPTKKPNPDAANPDQASAQPDSAAGGTAGTASNQGLTPAPPTSDNSPVQSQPQVVAPAPVQPSTPAPSNVVPSNVPDQPGSAVAVPAPAVLNTAPKRQPPQYVAAATKVPSSLQSQIASMTPEASGNKPLEAAMPSIEPVKVPETTERALLSSQPSLVYPANLGGKQGTATLDVLIGRDGSVQDAKFLQGSLAFARAAIDNVRQWKFKPYLMNGRPVSVQTQLTITFK